MAETSCTGSNWVPVEFTGYTCDVYPYKGGYETAKNIPVATCATVVEGEDGSDFLLIGHEMLYFGRDMDRSLINQNQVRHHIHHQSSTVQDDYTRSDVPFGINTGDAFILSTLLVAQLLSIPKHPHQENSMPFHKLSLPPRKLGTQNET